MRKLGIWLEVLLAAFILVRAPAFAAQSSQRSGPGPTVTPLAALVREARQNNPRILGALRSWQAKAQTPSIARTLPDPEFEVQQLSVGSPRPFAGFSNSNFAYLGFGISQQLPYPGKLRLKGEMAQREASMAGDNFEYTERAVTEQVRATYDELAAIEQIIAIVQADRQLLGGIERSAETNYRTGQGSEADVFNAQLQQTRLLETLSVDGQQRATLEAKLKQLVNRAADSPDITPTKLTETPLVDSVDGLLARVRTGNPRAVAQQSEVERRGLAVQLARKNFYPDFRLGYMWQHTAAPFRDYYMLTFGMNLPIHRSSRLEPELARAATELNGARRDYESQVQQTYFEVRQQYLAAETDAHILDLYRQGLLPQSEASFQASIASYESHQEDFETLARSFLNLINLNEEYWQTLANHEIAMARLEQLTGAPLFERNSSGTRDGKDTVSTVPRYAQLTAPPALHRERRAAARRSRCKIGEPYERPIFGGVETLPFPECQRAHE